MKKITAMLLVVCLMLGLLTQAPAETTLLTPARMPPTVLLPLRTSRSGSSSCTTKTPPTTRTSQDDAAKEATKALGLSDEQVIF